MKLGYVPVIVVAPPCVSETTWSGAVLLKVVPIKETPVPAEYVVLVFIDVITYGFSTVPFPVISILSPGFI